MSDTDNEEDFDMVKSRKSWEIKPITIKNMDKFNEEDYGIFKFPSLTLAVGRVASGKTTLLYNILEIFQPVFKGNFIIFSPTLMNDPLGIEMKEKDMYLEHFESYDNAKLQAVLELIRDENEVKNEEPDDIHIALEGKPKKKKVEKYMIIFDDTLSMLPNNIQSRAHKWWGSFISTYRHGGGIAGEGAISLLFFSQYYRDYSVVLRANASYYLFLGTHSEKDKKGYSEELCNVCDGDPNKFMELWSEAKDKNRYDFMTLDMRKLIVYKNFTTKLYERGENGKKNEPEKIESISSDSESDFSISSSDSE